MSLGPVDFQHMVAMAKEIERVQRLQEVRQHHQAQEIPQAYEKKVDRESRQVREVARGDNPRVEESAERDKRKDQGKKKEGKGGTSAKAVYYNGKASLHRLDDAEEGEHDLLV